MPLWRSVNEDIEIGDRIDDRYFVAEIKYQVPLFIIYGNDNARKYNISHPNNKLELQPETPKRYARLEGAQMDLFSQTQEK